MKKYLCLLMSLLIFVSALYNAGISVLASDETFTLALVKTEGITLTSTTAGSGTATGNGPFKSSGKYSLSLTTMNSWATATPDSLKEKYTQPKVSFSTPNVADIKDNYNGFDNPAIGSKVLKVSQDTGCAIFRVYNMLNTTAVAKGDLIKVSYDVYAANPKEGQKGEIDNTIDKIKMRVGARTKQTGSEKDMQYSSNFEIKTNQWSKVEYVFTVSSTDSKSAKEMHGVRIDVTASGDISKEAAFTSTFASEMFFDNIRIEKIASAAQTVSVTTTASNGGTVTGAKSVTPGTSVTVEANAKPGYSFDGWYCGGIWLSDSASYSFYPTRNTVLEAKFVEETPVVSSVIVTEEETYANSVYTQDKGTFTDKTVTGNYGFVRSKGFVSSQTGSDSIVYTLSDSAVSKMNTDSLIMTNVAVKSNEGTGKINIKLIGGNSTVLSNMEYAVAPQWTNIRVPLVISAEKLSGIEITTGNIAQNIEIANITVEDYTEATDKLDFIRRSGMYLLEKFEETELQDPGANPVMGKAIDLVAKGNYLYVIGGSGNVGYLMIGDISDKTKITKVSTVENLGQVRQVDITTDGKYVLVTGRHNGVTIIDVNDVKNPFIKGYYDSVEFATGICVSGNYMFVANRQYGVEIVDITDIDNPKQLSIVRSGEAQSCKVIDNYLYAGIWGECAVKIYDIRQPSEPKYVGKANLNGRGDGFSVAKSKDGTKTYLYAATGQHIKGASSDGLYTDPRYGMGNGMDVYDITDPANPKWLSTVKIDGKYYYTAVDYWETAFSRGEDGKDYAYLISIFNGVYIYDVTEPSMPIRLAHLSVPVYSSSPNFSSLAANDKNVFQFDQRTALQYSPVSSITARDGVLYLAGTYTDVHAYRNEDIIYEEYDRGDTSSAIEKDNGTFYKLPDDNFGLDNFKYYRPDGQVYYALTCGDYIFAACGNDGIHILDKDLKLIKKYDTERAVSHLQVIGDTLYSAENQAGLKFYKIEGATLTPVGKTYSSKDNNPVKMIQISSNKKWAVIQNGRLQFEIVNISDINSPTKYGTYSSSGHLYYRNLMNGFVDNRYMMCYSNPGTNCHSIIDFGENCESDAPVVKRFGSTNLGLNGGHAAYRNKAIAVKNGSIVVYNPADYMAESVTALPTSGTVTKSGVIGKPSIHRNVLMLSERMEGDVHFIDISNIEKPQVLKSFKIAGNPDMMTATDTYVLLPAGYQGLIKFDTDMFEEKPTISVKTSVSASGYKGTATFTDIPDFEEGFGAIAFVCAYDDNGNLKGMSKVSEVQMYAADGSKEVSAELGFVDGAKEYDFFLWNNMNDIKPYTKKQVIFKEYTLPSGGEILINNDDFINGTWNVPEANGTKSVSDDTVMLSVTTLPTKDNGVNMEFKNDLSGKFSEGDICLMTFKAQVTSGTGYIKGVVQAGSTDGWAKSLFAETEVAEGYWMDCYLPFVAKSNIIQAAFRFGGKIQNVQIKDFRLINYGKTLKIEDLPSTIK